MIKGRIYFLENKELTGFEKYKNEGKYVENFLNKIQVS